MPERWQTELRKIERLHPDRDLVERASGRPPTPLPEHRSSSNVLVMVVALIVPIALVLGSAVVLRDRSSTPRWDVPSAPTDPENGELLYAKYAATGWSLFAVDPSTGVERRITHGYRDYGSAWSPEGSKIVYDSEVDGESMIVVANADGSDAIVVGTGSAPAWSPDGSRIAYSGAGGRIWVINADGSGLHPVTDGDTAGTGEGDVAGYDWNASWSPDGNAIAYTRVVEYRYVDLPSGNGKTQVTLEELRVWNASDGTDTLLTDRYTRLTSVDWSPDGSTLVFTGAPTLFDEEETRGIAWPRVLTVGASGGAVTPISPNRETWTDGATWSPDGAWIAYVEGEDTIVVMRPDGSGRYEIAVDPGQDSIVGLSWGVAPSSGS